MLSYRVLTVYAMKCVIVLWFCWGYIMHLPIFLLKCNKFNTLRQRLNGRHFPDNIFECIFLNENWGNSIKFSLKFIPKVPINNILALVQIMAWCGPGHEPLSQSMMVSLAMHICVSRPQWVIQVTHNNVQLPCAWFFRFTVYQILRLVYVLY